MQGGNAFKIGLWGNSSGNHLANIIFTPGVLRGVHVCVRGSHILQLFLTHVSRQCAASAAVVLAVFHMHTGRAATAATPLHRCHMNVVTKIDHCMVEVVVVVCFVFCGPIDAAVIEVYKK
jgi:hypothetical protein